MKTLAIILLGFGCLLNSLTIISIENKIQKIQSDRDYSHAIYSSDIPVSVNVPDGGNWLPYNPQPTITPVQVIGAK